MTTPLRGHTIALAEGRQLEELAALLQAEGASILRCPLLSILDAPDPTPVEAWSKDLAAGKFDLLVLMTGEAVRRLVALAERVGRRDELVAALGRTPTLSRGPKPVQAMQELSLKVTRVAPAPTTEGVISVLQQQSLAGKTVAYTLYGSDNPTLHRFFTQAGAIPRPVMPYVFAPASDDAQVVQTIDQLAAGSVSVIVFTSSPQVDRIWEVATKEHREETLRSGLAQTRVAAVGPIVAETLLQKQVRVDVCPERGWVMKNLVRQIARAVAGSEA